MCSSVFFLYLTYLVNITFCFSKFNNSFMRKIINIFLFLLKIIDIYTYVRVLLFFLYTIVTDFFL